MFAHQLLNLVQRLAKKAQQESTLIEKMDLAGAVRIAQEKEELSNLYESCAREIQLDPVLRQEIKESKEYHAIQEALAELDLVLQTNERRILRVIKSHQSFVNRAHKELYGTPTPVQSYSRQGRMKGGYGYQTGQSAHEARSLNGTL